MSVQVGARVGERVVFTVAGRDCSWADVVSAAGAYGLWEELSKTARQGLGCRHRLVAGSERLDPGAVADAARDFRRARSLLAGEELEQWLARWKLTAAEWRDWIERTVLRTRWASELPETVARFPVTDSELETALWAEAVCTGLLEDAARRLAHEAALAAAAGEALGGDGDLPVARIAAAAARISSAALTPDAIRREIDSHALEWLRVEGQLLDLPDEDVAREAALSIRVDGRAVADVAAECEARSTAFSALLVDVDDVLAASLVAAAEGELVGPLDRNGSQRLVLVGAKTPPSADDPDVRRHAQERIVSRAVEHALREHVEWHEPL